MFIICNKKTGVIVTLLLFAQILNAKQSIKKYSNFINKVSIGISFGPSIAYTDVKQYRFSPVYKYESELKFSYNIYGEYTFNPIFGLKGDFLNGKLAGTKRDKSHYFNANYHEFSLSVTIGFSDLLYPKIKDKKIQVYGLIGGGITSFRSIRRSLEAEYIYEQYGYDGSQGNRIGKKRKAISSLVIPMGLGLKYKLTDYFLISAEFSMRKLNSDKLDSYITGPTNDHYNYYGIGINYRLGGSKN